MKINAIQLDTYSQNAVSNTASKDYSVLVNGEKYTVGSANHSQNFGSKDAIFNGNTAGVAAKKGYTVLINGEKYVVGASKTALAKTGAKDVILDVFRKLHIPVKKESKHLDVVA